MTFLRVEGLRKSYGGKRAVRDLSFALDEGEVLALLGPTGAGKSTTLLCLAGLERPDAGRIEMSGRDLTAAAANERDVAMVFEGLNLLSNLSVWDNIALPLQAGNGIAPQEIRARVLEVSEHLKIGHLLERTPQGLSGGETQRVAVARALVRHSGLYLLDEPMSALDLKLREALQAELKGLHAHYGSTVIYATHDFHGATAVADRLAIIADGRIEQRGSLEEILARPGSMTVGRLIGSPHMAFFDSALEDGRVRIEGTSWSLDLADFGPVESLPKHLTVGIWPEDIAVHSEANGPSLGGEVYAVNRRGMDKAIQIRWAGGDFRKAVPLDMAVTQGMACAVSFDAKQAFLFDREAGSLVAALEGQALEAASP